MANCSLCHDLEFQSGRQYRINFGCTVPLLEKSASQCQICDLIYKGILSARNHWPSETIKQIEIYGRTVSDYEGPSGLFADLYPPNESAKVRLEYFRSPDTVCEIKDCRASNIVPKSTSDDATFEWARKQIEACLIHSACATDINPNAVPLLPTGVLDLGTWSATNESVKLFVQDEHLSPKDLKRAKYACLSHRSGEQRQSLLTKDRLQELKKGIKWEELPKTFQDAIVFTRRLGVDYLWIDSLCIVQDDLQDWTHECAKMAEIFENGYFTIAATHSHSDSIGCFSSSMSLNKTTSTSIPNADGTRFSTIHSRIEIPHFEQKSLQEVVDNWPLLSRGWVFQERLLSTRVFHFTQRELIFECLQGTYCQCGLVDHSNSFKGQFTVGKWKSSRPLSDYNWISSWWKLIEDYSRLDLTFESDRLPAFAGLIKRISHDINEPEQVHYMAGVWSQSQQKHKTLRGLTWYILLLEPYGLKGKWIQSTTPSWSWASVNSPVSFIKDVEFVLDMGVFKDLQYIPKDVDAPFGEAQMGELTLAGKIVAGTLRFERGEDGDIDLSRYAIQFDLCDEDGNINTVIHPFFADYRLGEVSENGFPDWLEDDIIYCLFLWSNVDFRHVTNQDGRMLAIVAEQLDASDQVYRRIGFLDLRLPDRSSNAYYEILLRCSMSGVDKVTVI